MDKYEVTVLVASYNPGWKQLSKTIISALKQEDINFEIVVADDGSDNNYFSELKELFKDYSFTNYKLIAFNDNKGTCMNIYNGLCNSKGEYVKTIGPGDCFYCSDILSRWYRYAKKSKAKICFGDAIFFIENEDGYKITSARRYPQNTYIYSQPLSGKKAILNYVLLDDAVWGSNFLTDTKLLEYYLKKILGKIKYAEDMSYRMMIANGEKMVYFKDLVVWYEYGTGISTQGSNKWKKIIANERIISNHFIAKDNIFTGFTRKRFLIAMNVISHKKINWIKYVIFPSLIFYKVKKDSIKAKTRIDANIFELMSMN